MLGLSTKPRRPDMAKSKKSKVATKWIDDEEETIRRRARIETSRVLYDLNCKDAYHLISLFLRGPDYLDNFEIMFDMTDEDMKKLELLRGPHGYTLLKAGLARWGVVVKLKSDV
jgi:hypothetical protein